MWAPILIENKENILHALDSYIENLISFRDKIKRTDKDGLNEEMTKINKIRNILDLGK
jgi:prephenate dehydrogenase